MVSMSFEVQESCGKPVNTVSLHEISQVLPNMVSNAGASDEIVLSLALWSVKAKFDTS
jgi:hypothetical protein